LFSQPLTSFGELPRQREKSEGQSHKKQIHDFLHSNQQTTRKVWIFGASRRDKGSAGAHKEKIKIWKLAINLHPTG